MSIGLVVALSLNVHSAATAQHKSQFSGPLAGMGIMVGEVTPTSALVQLRMTETDHLVNGDLPGTAGVVEFILRPTSGSASSAENTVAIQRTTADASRDYIARAAFDHLAPGTDYVCTTRIGRNAESLRAGPTARFRTLPGADRAEPVRFVVVTGMNYARFHGQARGDRTAPVENPDLSTDTSKPLGYPALATILSLRPDFFVGTGDNVYYDTPTNPRAQTLPQLRQKWHEQFVQPRYRDLFALVPTYWEIDDHDYRRDDCDNSGEYQPSAELGRRLMFEQLPYAAADAADAKTYRTHRVSRDLQIWLTENRLHRSPNAMPDGPNKSIWGAEQKAWLKRTLQESDATFKLLISPTPMVGPDDLRKKDNHTNVGGFQHERDEFFKWLAEFGVDRRGFYVLCGDRHWQYHAVHPGGVEEFSCGALVTANSRLGRKPGDPQSTDPQALIRQPYSQDPASGGFLVVAVTPAGENSQTARLTFQFCDEYGKVLYEHTKTRNAEN